MAWSKKDLISHLSEESGRGGKRPERESSVADDGKVFR